MEKLNKTEVTGGYLNDENVSSRLPETEMEAAALRLSIADLLRSIPATWAQVDFDRLTKTQSDALFLLTAAGMVERRGWMRIMFANHPTCFEVRFQATGEGGLGMAVEHAALVEYHTWGDAWREWCEGETQNHSPFHVQPIHAQEWRLTDQGEFALRELDSNNPEADPASVFDFVLKRGFFGPGYWLRRTMASRRPLSADERGLLEHILAAGHDLTQLSRPASRGSGQLLEIRKIEQPAASQAVNLTNWSEGATAFAEAFAKLRGAPIEMGCKGPSEKTTEDAVEPDVHEPAPPSPTPFQSGVMAFHVDRVLLCGVDICSGPRSEKRRRLLDLLCERRSDGTFVAYSGDELAKKLELTAGKTSVASLIRDLREDLTSDLLREKSIICGRSDVVLSGGPGYRLSPSITVQFAPGAMPAESHRSLDPNVPKPADPNEDGPEEANHSANSAGNATIERKEWILRQLASGTKLRALEIAEYFDCSLKTAKRSLQELKAEQKIVFVGNRRTGSYRLKAKPSK